MRSPAVDRALRRLIAELAHIAPEDLESILSDLDAKQRQAVEDMLKAYGGIANTAPTPSRPSKATPSATAGLSPWLAVRVGSDGFTQESAGHAMTPVALAALKAAGAAASSKAASARSPAALARGHEPLLARRSTS